MTTTQLLLHFLASYDRIRGDKHSYIGRLKFPGCPKSGSGELC